MVNTKLYCAEQIAIPEALPNILKTYAKAAIRTQPSDLLRWSEAYFRCLANDVPPPVKKRLGREFQHGNLTKGYLKVLLDQVGKGYFISRRLLQQRWTALCLPEEELLKYLSVCRMLNWPQIHWLKLFAVMVGSLAETPRATLTLICELLTDDVDGGEASVPIWMFRVCYTFVAELDCSEEQTIVNGRKKLRSGELESEQPMDTLPNVFSVDSIKQAIFDKCTQRYNVSDEDPSGQSLTSLNNEEDDVSRASSVPSGFQLDSLLQDPKNIANRYQDFDSIILLLREAQGATLHQFEEPPGVTPATLARAQQRAKKVADAKFKQAQVVEDYSKRLLFEEKVKMLDEVGSPWAWLHRFTENGNIDTSYNFIDQQSIISDYTPTESSDESFDFRQGKPFSPYDTSNSSTTSDSSSEHLSTLLRSQSCIYQKPDDPLDILKEILNEKRQLNDVDSTVSSVVTFLCKEEHGVLAKAGRPFLEKIDIPNVIELLQAADQNRLQFFTIDEMVDYLKHIRNKYDMYLLSPELQMAREQKKNLQFDDQTIIGESNFMEDKVVLDEVDEMKKYEHDEEALAEGKDQNRESDKGPPKINEPTESERTSAEFGSSRINSSENVEDELLRASSEKSKEATATQESDQLSYDQPEQVDSSELEGPNVAFDEICAQNKQPMTEAFQDSGVLPEDTKLDSARECSIIGLKSVQEEIKDDSIREEDNSSISASDTLSEIGYASDISSLQPSVNTFEDRNHNQTKPGFICPHRGSSTSLCSISEGFTCTIPKLPGIGGPVSKKTIQDFLTYLKIRSRSQNGMIKPSNFTEKKCPKMIDTLE